MKTSESTRTGPIYLTGMGMVSALGFDAATSCAAARAGLSRAQAQPNYTVLSEDDGSETGVVCHAVPFATAGFEGAVRLRRLATLALQDLQASQPWLTDAGRTACYLSMPDPRRAQPAPEAPAPADEADEEDDFASTPKDPWLSAEDLWARSTIAAGWRFVPPLKFLALTGHTGFARAIERAAADLKAGMVDHALVGGVDSLLGDDVLAWLEDSRRLKTPENPAGLQPGEAGVFIVLESEASWQARGAKAHAVLRGLAFGQEPHLPDAGDPPSGKGLASALHAVISGIRFKHQLPLWCVTDQNGEQYRAMDWGCAEVHIADRHQANVVGGLSYCAASFGDTGAASGGIGLCIAAMAFERNYAPAPLAAVISAADAGERAVLLCQAA